MQKIEVCGHRILLKPHEEFKNNMSPGGIALPETDMLKREKAAQIIGTVVGIGPMAWKAFDGDQPGWKPWAEVGDTVIFSKYGGKFVTVNDETYIIIDDNDILGIFEEEAA